MNHENLGQDLRLEPGLWGYGLVSDGGDFATAEGAENLAQALLLRFNTPVGELAGLDHPEYGSRLHELIGRGNHKTTRNLVRQFTLDTLRQEPRVDEVHQLRVSTVPGRPDMVRVEIELSPIGAKKPLNLVFSVHLEGTS